MRRRLLLSAASAMALLGCNEPPQAGVLAITPSPATTTDALVAVFDEPVTDEDGDELTLEWTWRRDEVVVEDLTTDTVPAERTSRTEVWTAEVVAMDKRESTEVMTASVTVQNTPPTLSLTAPADTATTLEDLEVAAETTDPDEDALTLAYLWSVDGAATTFDGPTVPAAQTEKGQIWEVAVTVSDQDGPGATERRTTRIVNSAPSLVGAEVSPGEIREDTVVTCLLVGWDDADGDPEGATITWLVDGTEVATGPELTGARFDKAQGVACRAEPDDGEDVGEAMTSEPVTVLNTAPVLASATLAGAPYRTGDPVEATLGEVVDPDGDEVTLAYRWTVNGVDAGSEPILPAESHAKDDVVGLTLVPNDGDEDGPALVVDAVTIQNTPPTVVSGAITPDPAYTDDLLGLTYALDDADGDEVTVAVSWSVDGSAAGSGSTLDGTTAFDKNQTVVAELTPSDGADDGAPLTTAGLTISNSPPTAPAVVISPAYAMVGRQLDCLIDVDAVDADGDTLTYSARWTVDGVASTDATTVDFTDDTIPADITEDGEDWICYVAADDGTDTGAEGSETVAVEAWTGKRTFTSCSATGATGPSQAACNTATVGTTLEGEVTVSGGKQSWTVPTDGTYRIEVYGAQGKSAESGRSGGRGARMRGDFSLRSGDVLTIVVGQQGLQSSCNGGGGGASYVSKGSTPLVVAGGGGGTRALVDQNGCDANTAQQAGTGSMASTTHGCGLKSTSTIGDGGIISSSSWGSGGGSIVANGDGEYDALNGGRSLYGTAIGGGTPRYSAYGGFGGGGAGNGGCGGGGGGGYSGGDGGRLAGAGGSYNSGASQSNSAGARSGAGLVTVDLL